MTIKLNESQLATLPHGIERPKYDRSQLTAGIVHLGVGNFHRAHQAMYLHRLFELGQDFDWAICGAGVKSFDEVMRNKLSQQDWLTTVLEVDETHVKPVVIGSMIDFAEVNTQALIAKLSQPAIRIVSLTITEGGYFIDQKTGKFDLNADEIQQDIANPAAPTSVFGILIEALNRRYQTSTAPFTVMSCDNIPHNGDVTKNAVLTLARRVNPELAKWIATQVTFPNSMVDCIAPMVREAEIHRVQNLTGIADNAPVLCEPFRQWVLEDNFVNGRPQLEAVGVQFVDDVTPYELMKLRILNGGHAAMAYPAALLGIEFAHDAIGNPLITAYLDKLASEEIIPSLETPAEMNLDAYYQVIKQRFGNSEVKDTIARLCQDASNRLPKFILPTIANNLTDGRGVKGLSLVIALWRELILQVSANKRHIDLAEPQLLKLLEYAKMAEQEPYSFFQLTDIFGDLGSNLRFVEAFSYWVTLIAEKGVEQALSDYVTGE